MLTWIFNDQYRRDALGDVTRILTNMSVPSVIFADANWYGSLRGGVEVGGGNDASFKDGGSRWGIKGSSEISEGLSAIYRFEHKISTTDASQPGGRLAYAGLSGSFGTVSLGQIWSASFNHVGGITDGSWFYGNSETSYRVGNALSYAMSAGAISMQLDAVMDGGTDTGESVDQLEFGMTVSLGDIGKLGLAYIDTKDSMVTNSVFMEGTPTMVGVTPGMPNTPTVVETTTPGMPNTPTVVETTTPGSVNTPTVVETTTPGSVNTPTVVETTTRGSVNTPTVVSSTATGIITGGDVVPVSGTGSSPMISVVPGTGTDGSAEMQATWQFGFEIGDDFVNVGTPVPGMGDDDEDRPSMPNMFGMGDDAISFDQAFDMAFNNHFGIFTPTGGSESVRGGVTYTDSQAQMSTHDVTVTLGGSQLTENNDGKVVTAEDITVGTGDNAITIPAGAEASESLANAWKSYADKTTIKGNAGASENAMMVSGYVAAVEPVSAQYQITPGTGTPPDYEIEDGTVSVTVVTTTPGSVNTPTVVETTTPGSVNTPTVVETTTPGSVNTPTVVETTTPGAENTPTVVETTTPGAENTPTMVAVTPGEASHYDDVTSTVKGSRATHVAAQFSLGAITAYLGYSQNEENGSGMKDKTTHYGISGGLGDTGISFHAMARSKDNASGMDSNPWLVGLTKGLGGGATVMVEHGNADDGKSGKTRFGLKVDF